MSKLNKPPIMDDEGNELCRECNVKMIVDAPPFHDMSDSDIEDWKLSGGHIVTLCPNGCETGRIV